MAYNTTNTMVSADIYKVASYIDKIKAKYVDVPEDTLILGVYGYLTSVMGNLTQNTAILASEYSTEAIPTKAKYERNVIAHALALGINSINANPAKLDILLCITEDDFKRNATNNKLRIDKEFVFQIGEDQLYPYLLDYDIIITKHVLPTGKYMYTAKYDLGNHTNKLANVATPFLPAIGYMNISGDKLISIKTTLRQVTHTQIYKNIITTNPLETKTMTFSFNNQLAYFYLEVNPTDSTNDTTTNDNTQKVNDTIIYQPIYDGLYDYSRDPKKKYVNYSYLDEKTIRLRFDRDTQPRSNCQMTVHVYTTLGETCNFKLNNYEVIKTYTTDKDTATNFPILIKNVGDSEFGSNKLTIAQLKRAIPAEALSRGSVTTYTDLVNFFNQLQNEKCRLYLLRKVHNQIERLYYLYIMMKDGDNVIPTNTINITTTRSSFDNINKDTMVIKPMSLFFLDPDEETAVTKHRRDFTTTEQLEKLDSQGFLYTNPYLVVVSKSPFYVSYYLTLVNYQRELYFEYVNDESIIQFVATSFSASRSYYDDYDTFKITMNVEQSINTNFQLVTYEDDGTTIKDLNFKVYGVLYTTNKGSKEETPYRYIESEIVNYNQSTASFQIQFKFKLNDIISAHDTYIGVTSGLKSIGTGDEYSAYLPKSVNIKFFFTVKYEENYGTKYTLDTDINKTYDLADYIPNLKGWSLTNIYNAGDAGLDIFYDYSDICNSYIDLKKSETGQYSYTIYKMPVVRRTYLNSDTRIQNFLELLDNRRRYIQMALFLLDDSFGIDYKFFNTYGKSKVYNIENETNIDRINLKLTFEIKFESQDDQYNTLNLITKSIKDYIEDMNELTDLHIPNLITYITNLYRENIVYIKFIKLNNYDSLYQSIYKNPEIQNNYFYETQTVPEFINVNTKNDNTPDIDYIIKDSTT